MNTQNRFRPLAHLCGATALLMVAGATLPVHADNASETIIEPGQTFFGKSYNQLTGDQSNWLSKEPTATNPALDDDGRYCDRNQSGNIWFLAGTFGGQFGEDAIANRRCEIPAGKALFFPIVSFISFAPEFLNQPPCQVLNRAVNQIRCDVNDDVAIAPNVGLKVIIDGKPVDDLFAYRVQSQPSGFTLRIAPGSPLTAFVSPGPRKPTVADGYYIFLKPLSPGHHTVSPNPDQGVTYQLRVVR